MINPGLKLPFAWYTDIDMQNRYKENCSAICDFKLVSPVNKFLPFQIRTDLIPAHGILITHWRLMCAQDNSLYRDLTPIIGQLDVYVLDDVVYLIYDNEADLTADMDCGSYYLEIETSDTENFPNPAATFYSEVFVATDFTETLDTEQLPLFTAWRWYDNIDKQTRYKGNCSATCDYYLISGNDALLPFQLKTELQVLDIDEFKLVAVDGSCERLLDTTMIHEEVFGSITYLIYYGDLIADLECGSFYGVISATVTDGIDIFQQEFYSELIKLVQITEVDPTSEDYLLQETGFKILQETGFGLLLE